MNTATFSNENSPRGQSPTQEAADSTSSLREKVFISYLKEDQRYQCYFQHLLAPHFDLVVKRAFQLGDIDPNQNISRVKRIVREEFLADSTVTVVLVGQSTWQSKHIDWEIAASARHTDSCPTSGVIGILLPTYRGLSGCNEVSTYNRNNIPARLEDNLKCGFARLYRWSDDPDVVKIWIQQAVQRVKTITPNNRRPLLK